MCGRYVLVDGKVVFAVSAQLQTWRNEGKAFDIIPRYDARPTDLMPVVAQRSGAAQVTMMRWGLIPHWSKDGKTEFTTFNAKSETLHTSKLFSPYFKAARCLVPASGFFEWKRFTAETIVRGKPKLTEQKQKMFIRMKDASPFMMAGLFSVWKNDAGEEFPTYTVITTAPNELMQGIHDRMPVILPPEHYDAWIDRSRSDVDLLRTLLVPYPADRMAAYAVKNKADDAPDAIERIEFEVPPAPDLMKSTRTITAPPKKH